jgi:hypothetical protein
MEAAIIIFKICFKSGSNAQVFYTLLSPCIDDNVCRLAVVRDWKVTQTEEKFDLTHLVVYLPRTKEKLGIPEE